MADLGSLPALKAAIAARIFPNTTFEVSAKDIDDSFIDTIDTLKGQLIAFNETNYGDLIANYNGGTLVPGAFYAFDYEHKYVVDFAGGGGGSGNSGEIFNTDVSTIHEMTNGNILSAHAYAAPVEKIIVQAVAVDQLHPQAISTVHPTDIIHYDITDDTTEESNATSGNRTGFIHYRKDTILNIEADFDFRNSIGYFNKIDGDVLATKQYNDHPILAANNQAPPAAFNPVIGHNTSMGSLFGFTLGARVYMRMLGPLYNSNVAQPSSLNYKNISIGKYDGFVSYGANYSQSRIPNTILAAVQMQNIKISTETTNIALTGNSFYNIEIGNACSGIVANSSVLTPGQAITAAPFSLAAWTNVKIGDGCNNYVSGGGTNVEIGSSVNNIDQSGTANSVKIKNNSSNITILDGVNYLEIEENCQDIVSWASSTKIGEGCAGVTLIHSGQSLDTQNVIGKNCDDIIMMHSGGIKIGQDNNNLRILHMTDSKIGDQNENLYLMDGMNHTIGDGNVTIEMQAGQGHMVVGNNNQNLRMDASYCSIGDNNENIYFIDPIVDSTIGNHNVNVYMFACSDVKLGDRNSSTFFVNSQNVKLGDGNNIVTLESNTDVVIGSNNSRITKAGYPVFFVPSYSFDSTIRGIIFDTAEQADLWSGTEYVNFVRALHVFSTNMLGVSNSAGGGTGLTIGSHCDTILLAGGSDIVIGDNVENFINCHEFDFADANDLVLTLTAVEGASDVTLTVTSNVGGVGPGSIVTLKDTSNPTPTITAVTADAGDLGLTLLATGGTDVTIDSNLSDIKLKSGSQGVRVQASTVDLTQISDVVIQKSVTIPAGATGDAGAVIDLVSPDGKAWYETIDNAGAITRTKYE